MIITRMIDGTARTFELNTDELHAAYYEMQRVFDEADIEELIIGMSASTVERVFHVTPEQFRRLIPEMAKKYRYLLNRHDDSDAKYDAVRDVIAQKREAGEL